MIVSHEHRFVFIKTRKTAGTSVEVALSQICGPADIITEEDEEGERLRRELGGRGAQNDSVPLRGMTLLRAKAGITERSWPKLYSHFRAKDVRRMLGSSRWNEYFKFTVERNPWDRAVSHYFWDAKRKNNVGWRPGLWSTRSRLALSTLTQGERKDRLRRMQHYSALAQGQETIEVGSFSEYLRTCPLWKLSSWDIYTINDSVAVDRVLRYEQLEEELGDVWRQLQVPPPRLPQAKSQTRPNEARDWRAMFTDEDVALVADICSREIEAFGYTFEPH